jgi:hypothetical protein
MTCKTCCHSFKVLDHERYQILMCWPGGNRHNEQIAPKVACELHAMESDEVEA